MRRSLGRPLKPIILIVGEGRETEPNYFDGLRREDRVAEKFTVRTPRGHGLSPERVVEKAITRQTEAQRSDVPFEEVWCVLDVEGPEKRPSLDRAIALARQNDIALCLSNPSFEIWMLSHFAKTAKAYNDCDDVIVDLDKYWKKHCNQPYQKNDDRIYDRLADLTETAIANAKWVRETHHRGTAETADCNSSTEVYRLASKLIG